MRLDRKNGQPQEQGAQRKPVGQKQRAFVLRRHEQVIQHQSQRTEQRQDPNEIKIDKTVDEIKGERLRPVQIRAVPP